MANETQAQLVILRFSGEMGTKARATRYQFNRRLLQNLRDALLACGFEPRIEFSRDRIFVELPPDADPSVLTRVFGIQSVSHAPRPNR